MCELYADLIQKLLLLESELILAKVTEITLTFETAAKDTLVLQGSKESEVNKVTNGSNSVPNVRPKF